MQQYAAAENHSRRGIIYKNISFKICLRQTATHFSANQISGMLAKPRARSSSVGI